MLAYILPFLVLCLLCVDDALSLRVPLEGRTMLSLRSPQLHARGANTTVAVKSVSNTEYLASITVGGYVAILTLFLALTLKSMLVVHSPL